MTVRVIIADDQPVFRRAARKLLERRGYVVVGEADSASVTLRLVERLLPDAVLLDIRLGDDDGLRVCAALIMARPTLSVLLVSADQQHPEPTALEASGARGFLLKSRLGATDLSTYWPDPERR
jgi:DNA-binding NarL/FixJ family response regulator